MNKIVILAAGKGTRMNSDLPKVLVPVCGKPIIKHLLNSVVEARIDAKPIIIVSPENIEQIKLSLENYNVEYAIQEQQLGTGHAAACAIKNITSECDKVLIFNGDHPFIKAETIKKLAASNGDITMLTAKSDNFTDWEKIFYHWGRIVRQGDQIKEIKEFKDSDEETKKINEVNPAMYAFGYVWLKENIDKINTDNAQKEFYLTDLIGLAFEQDKKIDSIYVQPEEAIGINSLEELAIAENIFNIQ
ncbi:MAG: Bifunctional protein GlmU [Parcubacteria group bacterium GW2011_GWE2_38_18]|nr:MAG: Bifunctional protein GlmU [Parcubacteria group bacterium GW2011_GWE2_38_18]